MDDWQFDDTSEYDGYSPGGDNTDIDTSYGDTGWNDYNGYTPGGDYSNVDTNYDSYVPDYFNSSPDWFSSGDPNVMGSNAAPLAGASMGNLSTNYGGDIKNLLSGLFSGGAGTNILGKGIAALFEGNQNRQKASAATALSKNAALDPFGSQRPFYQQQAQQAVTNPYDSPIVKAQVAQLQNAQNIKDAAAGRRSNQLTSAPSVLAAQAKIAQDYQQQMAQQGGSNIAPNQQLASILQSGSNAGINGYVSPLANAYGNTSTTTQLDALKKFLAGQS